MILMDESYKEEMSKKMRQTQMEKGKKKKKVNLKGSFRDLKNAGLIQMPKNERQTSTKRKEIMHLSSLR